MKLQMAIDLTDTQGALDLAMQTSSWVDIIEIGTPMIVREGMVPVREMKKRFPDKWVLADTKIVDGGAIECGDAVKAGADLITVLAAADRETIREVVRVAQDAGRRVMADLITVTDIPAAAREMQALGVDYICIHTGVDAQRAGRTPLTDLQTLLTAIEPERAAVAGGIGLKTLPQYAALNPGILIAGGALTGAKDPAETARRMKEAMA